jgi:stage II sporulation protein D
MREEGCMVKPMHRCFACFAWCRPCILRMLRRTRYFITAAALLVLLLNGCAAPPTVRDERAPETRVDEIRIAIKRYDQKVAIFVAEGFIDTGGSRLSIQSPKTLSVDRVSLQWGHMRVPLPATIRSDRAVVLEGRPYYGHLLIQDGYVINIIPIDVYTVGVLSAEVPASWPIEALKAQAVVSRTYAYNRILRNQNSPFDAGSSEMYQKYEYGEGSTALEEAVMATKDEVLLYRDEPIEAFFHSCSGGRTESSRDVFQDDLPYLRSIPDPYCAKDERFAWSYRVDAEQIGRILRELGMVDDQAVTVRDIRAAGKTGSGRVKDFLISLEQGGQVVVGGNQLRLALDPTLFKSLLITRIEGESSSNGMSFLFQGRGYGHGVGMSQWGAKGMADRGFSYRKILAYYYPGTRIGRIWDIR